MNSPTDTSMREILSQLIQLQQKPAPFTPGEALFWDDPHISLQMLEAHLNPEIDAASRRPETIERSVQWLIKSLPLHTGDPIVDLGCGPGLYAARFARAGLPVTAIDYSRRSIDYARNDAWENGLNIQYRCQNYLEWEEENLYRAAFLIYGDFCTIGPEQRSRLLKNIQRALQTGGKFVLDVSTGKHRVKHGNKCTWRALETGFWKPGPHVVLEDGFDYPEQAIWLDQYTVIEADGKVSVYRNWFQDYTPESITAELTCGGFEVESLWGDLTGTPYTPDSEWIGMIACKR